MSEPIVSAPKLVLPPPAPQSEAEGLKNPDTPKFSFAPNPVAEKRIHPDATRNPMTKKFTPKGM